MLDTQQSQGTVLAGIASSVEAGNALRDRAEKGSGRCVLQICASTMIRAGNSQFMTREILVTALPYTAQRTLMNHNYHLVQYHGHHVITNQDQMKAGVKSP